MGAYIAQHIGRPGFPRIHAPCGGCSIFFNGNIVVTVRKLHIDDTNRAKIAICNHFPRLLDHLMAGIAVGYEQDPASRLNQRFQFFGLL